MELLGKLQGKLKPGTNARRGITKKMMALGGEEKKTITFKDPEAQGRKVLGKLREYFTRGPIIAIIFRGEDAIKEVRRITGYTDPKTAEKGTIRGDLGADSIEKSTAEGRAVENMIHASGNPEEAEAEIKLWFPEK